MSHGFINQSQTQNLRDMTPLHVVYTNRMCVYVNESRTHRMSHGFIINQSHTQNLREMTPVHLVHTNRKCVCVNESQTHRMSHELINDFIVHHERHELIHAVSTGVLEKDISHESSTRVSTHDSWCAWHFFLTFLFDEFVTHSVLDISSWYFCSMSSWIIVCLTFLLDISFSWVRDS